MADLLEPLNRSELLAKIKEAGENNLNEFQTAIWLGLTDRACRNLMHSDTEAVQVFVHAKMRQAIAYLNIIKDVANDCTPENKQRFGAGKYLYELYSGNRQQNNTFIAVQQIAPDNVKVQATIKLLESLDERTIEAIESD